MKSKLERLRGGKTEIKEIKIGIETEKRGLTESPEKVKPMKETGKNEEKKS